MILFYTLLLLLLGLARLLIAGRAGSLEKRYGAAAGQALKLGSEPCPKPGNGKADVFAAAKRTYELGRLVQKRDVLESKYYRWRGLADRLTRWVDALREWKGRKLPYTLGALDVWLVLYLVDYLGVGRYVSVKQMVDTVLARFVN